MDFLLLRSNVLKVLIVTAGSVAFPGGGTLHAQAETASIQFDMPAAATAMDTSRPGEAREITLDLVLSSLVASSVEDSAQGAPPIDHLLVRCRLRERLPVVDYSPKTELQTDYAGPISVTQKQEQTDSFGLSVDGAVSQYGAAHLGSDDTTKQSDSTQFQRQAPMQAVIASGTFDRGRGVYFKLRWTTQQVLEGEKHFQVSFAVPEAWRGGLVDVTVTANGIDRSLFSAPKLRAMAQSEFVIAAYQQHDVRAAEIAMRLASLDQKLAAYCKKHPSSSSGITQFWRRILKPDEAKEQGTSWYRGITKNEMDPYHDRRIQSLPMPVRVAVLGYTDAARELMELRDAG